jgi:very-short-patch-repair endonuclease
VSKGADELLTIVKQLFPNQRIELEYNVADRGALFLDIFLPRLNLAFEYDGEQHFHYIEHFHGSRMGFAKARKRDLEKDEICKKRGITLIRVAYNEEMTKDTVSKKLEEADNE